MFYNFYKSSITNPVTQQLLYIVVSDISALIPNCAFLAASPTLYNLVFPAEFRAKLRHLCCPFKPTGNSIESKSTITAVCEQPVSFIPRPIMESNQTDPTVHFANKKNQAPSLIIL